MIRQETITKDGIQLLKTFSDSNRYVVRDGISYSEAIDPIDSGRTYTEGDEMPDEEISEEEAIKILMGG